MEKYVVWGAGAHARLLMDNFLYLEDYVELFLDYEQKEINGIPVVNPQNWKSDKKVNIVICTKNFFHEVYNELVHKYGVEKERIISSHEWICKLLKEKKIQLCPKRIRLETCTLCQLDCTYCYMRTENYSATGCGYLSYDKFSRFVEENPHINQIEISNSGEPFLNPDLAKILTLAYEKKIGITIGNGTNFNDVSDELLELMVKTKVQFINISIDGASQEIYEIYRRRGNFDKVINNIKKLNNYKEKYNSEYPILQWQYVLMQHNECDVEKATIMAKQLGIKNMFFKFDCIKDEFVPKDRAKLEKITGMKYFSRKEYNKDHYKIYFNDMCEQAIFMPQINWDGRLLGCCMIWREDYGINVFEEGLVNALNSERYLEMIFHLLGIEQKDVQLDRIPCVRCEIGCYNMKNGIYWYL